MPVIRADSSDIQETWRGRIKPAREEQTLYHGTYASNLAFAAGQQWLVWSDGQKKLRHIQDVDPKYQGRELFTADRITEHRQAALGELTSDDDRPQLISAQEGDDPDREAGALNSIAAYAWDQEWKAPSALQKARRLCIDLGVSAIRCRWDPNAGAEKQEPAYAPLAPDGSPMPPEAMMALAQQGAMPDGSLPKFKKIAREGRSVWETYSAFEIFSPPGIVHEDEFPWEIVGCPVLVDDIKDIYGVEVREDTGILSSAGLVASTATESGAVSKGRLRDHAWMYHCFQRPSIRYPNGRTAVLAGTEYALCDAEDELPYKLYGEPHSGIVYFHWWRLSDRFRSRGLVETMKDPQRIINRRKTQNLELIDRGMPKLITRKGDYPGDLTGAVLEVIELGQNAQQPQVTPAIGPGGWMFQDIASLDEDLSHASTLSPLRLGENPTNVDTYSQLALLNDNEQGKRGSIIAEHREGIGHLVMLSLSDVEEYWPDEKQGLILGPEQSVESVTLKKSDIPTQYRVRPATGQPQPRSQGAQVKKIDAIWQAAVASLVVQTDPAAWTDWYKRSLEAGQPQKLPAAGATSQDQIISLENMLMRQGEWVEPAYYDPIQLHVPGHRMEQDRARAEGDTPTAQLLEQHIQRHLYWSTVNAQQQAAIGPQPEPQDATTGGPATESQPAQGSSAGPPVPPTSTP